MPSPSTKAIWTEAACRDADTELFYPTRDDTYLDTASQAKEYCRGTAQSDPCPVLLECLLYGLVTEDRFGIWGGMSPRERNALRRSRTLSKYREAQQDSPYYQLIEEYLTRGHRSEEEDGEGDQRTTEDLPGCDEV